MYFNTNNINWRITQCCQFYDIKYKKFNFGTVTKTSALKKDGKEKVQFKAIENCKKLNAILHHMSELPINLRSFRISQDLLPCYTLDFTKDWYKEIEESITKLLKEAGNIAKKYEIRLSVHPSQFTVLGSNNIEVVKNSIIDIEYHALYGLLMNLSPEDFVVNIHLQGLYSGKHSEGIKRFSTNYGYLSDYAQKCLAVENEDKPNGYDIMHTLELSTIIPIRCTLDIHHYMCHRMTQIEKIKNSAGKLVNRKIRDVEYITVNHEYFKEAVKTWKNIRPLFHKSQSFPIINEDYWMKVNAHSDFYYDEELMSIAIPMLEYADFDIEAKNKEQAVKYFYNYIKEEELYAGEKLECKIYK
jgi:UV DNA damage repair endonuclease